MKKISLVSIIDDDIVFQYSTKKRLESSEVVEDIIQFYDGEEAIDYFLENKNNEAKTPDLVFLDLEMPYLDGWQFLDKFTANEFKKELITIYLCSSSNSQSDLDKVEAYPKLQGYLIKPISTDKFTETLEEEVRKISKG